MSQNPAYDDEMAESMLEVGYNQLRQTLDDERIALGVYLAKDGQYILYTYVLADRGGHQMPPLYLQLVPDRKNARFLVQKVDIDGIHTVASIVFNLAVTLLEEGSLDEICKAFWKHYFQRI